MSLCNTYLHTYYVYVYILYIYMYILCIYIYATLYHNIHLVCVWPPRRMPAANEGSQESPTRHMIVILVVDVGNRGNSVMNGAQFVS